MGDAQDGHLAAELFVAREEELFEGLFLLAAGAGAGFSAVYSIGIGVCGCFFVVCFSRKFDGLCGLACFMVSGCVKYLENFQLSLQLRIVPPLKQFLSQLLLFLMQRLDITL